MDRKEKNPLERFFDSWLWKTANRRNTVGRIVLPLIGLALAFAAIGAFAYEYYLVNFRDICG